MQVRLYGIASNKIGGGLLETTLISDRVPRRSLPSPDVCSVAAIDCLLLARLRMARGALRDAPLRPPRDGCASHPISSSPYSI